MGSGELSGLSGSFLLMTATATPKTRRLLQSELPEVKQWINVLNPPLRNNVLLVVPPPSLLSSRLEDLLAPFIDDIVKNGKTYLVIVRSINKGSEVFLHILRSLISLNHFNRPVAFYHRNTSEERKVAILNDLKLSLNSPDKVLRCVVATVSLGKLTYDSIDFHECHIR